MSKKLTLEEQHEGLRKMPISGMAQHELKITILATLTKLIALRKQIEQGPGQVDNDRFAEDLAAVLGDSPTLKGS
jgi:hypothetical protein